MNNHHDMEDLLFYVNKLAVIMSENQAFSTHTDFVDLLAQETLVQLVKRGNKRGMIKKFEVAGVMKQTRGRLQARYRQGRPYSPTETISGTRISFAKKFGQELDRFETENARPCTRKERKAIAQQIRDEWPDQNHRPPRDMLDEPPVVENNDRVLELIPHVDENQSNINIIEDNSQLRYQVWDFLAPTVPVQALPGAIVSVSLRALRDRDSVARHVRAWPECAWWQEVLLFAPFTIRTVEDQETIVHVLLRHVNVAAELLECAYQRARIIHMWIELKAYSGDGQQLELPLHLPNKA